MTQKQKPEIYGRFYLTKLLGLGGMAEIFKAKSYGIGGFEKTLAIKRILPQFTSDEKLMTMLTDEARLTVQLNHKNIIQVFDFGEMDDRYYISMELVEGIDLIKLLTRLKKQGKTLPPEIACYIASEMCQGLDFAHKLKDSQGNPLNIIHRDVSPHNVLLSYNGDVKIADFGIAKAASNLSHTQTGTIKGKVLYLSPEQINKPKDLDHRSDVFAVGLVLFEMLFGKRLFDGTSQIEVLRTISAADIKEENLPATLPQNLRKIIAKALAHDRDQRYADAAAFSEDLQTYIRETNPKFSATEFKKFIQNTYEKDIKQSEQELDPPISENLKSQLIHYTGEKIMARAEESKEILEKTMVTQAIQTNSTSKAIRNTLKHLTAPLFFFSLILFLFSDFLKPLFSLAPFVFLMCGGLAAVTWLSKVKQYRSSNPMSKIVQSRPGEVLIFASASFLIWGLIMLFSFFTPARGVLAANIPPIASLQASILKISADVEEIKTATKKIEKKTEEIKQETKEIKEQTTEIATGIKDIRLAIEALKSKGTALIDNPQYPQDFYHNARVHELVGRSQQAIESYKQFLDLEPNFIDVHTNYQTLLNNTVGIERTRTLYTELESKYPGNLVVKLAKSNLMADEIQMAFLKTAIQENPKFSLAYMKLGEIYFKAVKVGFAINKIALTKEYFDKYNSLDQQGEVKRYYISKDALQDNQNIIEQFNGIYNNYGANMVKNPIDFRVNDGGDGLLYLTIQPRESGVDKVFYKLNDESDWKDMGINPWIKDPNTGKELPNVQVTISKPKPGIMTIWGRYTKDDLESPIKKYEYEVK